MTQTTQIQFFNPGELIDNDLILTLFQTNPSNPEKNLVPNYLFQMRRPGEEMIMGKIRLRISNNDFIINYAGHIGYNVLPEFRGQHYAARSCRLLFPLAKKHGLNPLWITCNPDNIASARSCEIIGGQYIETVNVPVDSVMYQQGDRQKKRYRVNL